MLAPPCRVWASAAVTPPPTTRRLRPYPASSGRTEADTGGRHGQWPISGRRGGVHRGIHSSYVQSARASDSGESNGSESSSSVGWGEGGGGAGGAHGADGLGEVGRTHDTWEVSAPRECPQQPLIRPSARRTRTNTQTDANPRVQAQLQYGPSRGDPDSYDEDPRFGVFGACNDPTTRADIFRLGAPGGGEARRTRLTPAMSPALRAKCSNAAVLRFAEEMCARSAVDSKELFESAEFWHRTRRRVRRRVVVDMACGCGLTGVLFAVAERTVEHVVLVDHTETDSLRRVLAAAEAAAPWAIPKISFIRTDIAPGTLRRVLGSLPSRDGLRPNNLTPIADTNVADVTAEIWTHGTVGKEAGKMECVGVLAVHACGSLTDTILDEAVACDAALAAMPCCYTGTAKGAPAGVRRALGVSAAADVMRSFKLQGAGYHVDWAAIPRAVTPLNRILVGDPPRGKRRAVHQP